MATYAYARVSSTDQNLDRQLEALKPYITDDSYLYCDKCSGKDFNRPAYKQLVGDPEKGIEPILQPNDTLIILSLDRLSRDYAGLQHQWFYISHTLGCNIKVIDLPLLDTSVQKGLDGRFISDLVLQILGYVAQKERENIKKRQRQGIDIALSKGVHFGKKAMVKPTEWDSTIALMNEGSISATEAMKRLNMKRTTFYKLLKQK